MATGSVQTFNTQHDTYTHANGAVVNCYRSGNVVTISATSIAAADPIPTGQSFSIDVNMDSKYRPPYEISAIGSISGNWDYDALTKYRILGDGSIQGYSYHGVGGGSFTITYVV